MISFQTFWYMGIIIIRAKDVEVVNHLFAFVEIYTQKKLLKDLIAILWLLVMLRSNLNI